MTKNDPQQIRNEIDQERVRLAQLVETLERNRGTFVVAAVAFAKQWYVKCGRDVASSEPDVTAKLTNEQIAEIKRALQALADGADDRAHEVMHEPGEWWHLNKQESDPEGPEPKQREGDAWRQFSYVFNGNRAPDGPDRSLRRLLGSLIGVMTKYGYKLTFGLSGSSLTRRETPKPTEPWHWLLDWPPELRSAIAPYAQVQEEAKHAVYRLRSDLFPRLRRAEASSRWDES